MIKELKFYQFNFLDPIYERVNSRLAKLNKACEVYQNSKRAIICDYNQNYCDIYRFSTYKDSLIRIEKKDYKLIYKTIRMILEENK